MKVAAGLACVLAACAMPVEGAQRVESVNVASSPVAAVVDPTGGRLLVAHGETRTSTGSIAILDRDGRTSTVALPQPPSRIAMHAGMRRLLSIAAGSDQVTLLDVEGNSAKALRTGRGANAIVMSEAATAFVLGASGGDGTATLVDLRAATSRTVAWSNFRPDAGAATRDASRLYMTGTQQGRAVVQAFDATAKRLAGDAVALDMAPFDIALADAGNEVLVLGITAGAAPRVTLRRFDASLALQQTFDLGATDRADAALAPHLESDGQQRAWVIDPAGSRLWVIDLEAGTARVAELEAQPSSFAYNRVANTLLVAMRNGQAAVFSLAGARLDTLPIARTPASSNDAAMSVSIDGATGDAYVLNAAEGTVARLPREANADAPFNITDLWLNPAEPGWGVFLDQQGTTAFGTLFIHNARGEATWFVMSNGTRQPDGSFSGLLYRTQGGGGRTGMVALPTGLMRFTVGDHGKASVTYVVDGLSQTRPVERFALGSAARVCGWAVAGERAVTNFTGLWSNPTDPGWGVAVAQRGSAAFGVLFSYDDQNRPTWMVMSNGRQSSRGTFSGDLYRASKTRIEATGAMTLRFTPSAEGSIAYRIEGTQFRAPLLRQSVGKLLSRCEP